MAEIICSACEHRLGDHLSDGRCAEPGCGCPAFSVQFNDCTVPNGAETAKLLSDGRRCCLYRTITGARFLIGDKDDDIGGYEEYMFHSLLDGVTAFEMWDGYGEPDNWIRHRVGNQTRRRDPDNGRVAVSEDP